MPLLVEPQTLRFTGESFLDTRAFSKLPYTPAERITSTGVADLKVDGLSREVLDFEQERGCAAYIAPALPLYDEDGSRGRV